MSLLVDKLTGNIYLFDILTSSGGTGSGGTASYPQVNTFAGLPSAAAHAGEIYIVLLSTGLYVLNRKEAGMYYSNGSTWTRLGDIPSFFNDDNFQVYDGTDNTKKIRFQLSGLTTSSLRTITVRNSDGTIAYLSDLNAKVDKTLFNTYTGSTAPVINSAVTGGTSLGGISVFGDKLGRYLRFKGLVAGSNINLIPSASGITISASGGVSISLFTGYTATTETRLDYIETTLAGLIGGTANNAIQVVDLVGGINVNNITPISIQWTSVEFSGNSLNYTGASRIYIQTTGKYEITYNLVLKNGNNTSKTIGSVIKMNGTTNITPLSVATYIDNGSSITGSNNISNYKKTFNAGDYVELQAFRISNSGIVNTVPGGSWIRIIKI